MMSQDQGFVQCVDPASTGSPQAKSGAYDSSDFIELYNLVAGNDLLANDLFNQTYDFSPELTSSMTTPSLIYDVSTPQDLNDSPLFNAPFMSSPSLDPAVGFFPDLPNDHNASNTNTRSLMQLSSTPSVPSLPSVNIPWTTDVTTSSSTDNNVHSSSTSPSVLSNFSDVNSPVLSSNTTSSASTSPLTTSLRTRNRKRSANEIDKDPIIVADELAMKRAKNTDAARRSRLRKVKRMESLEKEVTILKNENIDLQTRIAVLESEKKGLEDKNAEKDARVKMMEQRLTEAHDRLVKINNTK
ncbi:uncharacterized protein OCT59_006783 [Rhizophagus irregularis]|uniref:BZIP domain-containing protein n=5 Tax=Rhizophagus irregularis TaxID=588596 RepID=A0A916EJW0_9GLOM|nr:Gcn4p [Rhizophagus irregularis DAOM 197198w]UZO15356.1 hypothetical protein OCT59_006783 [Rhizophagus irregularis]GET61873.1 basic-leucine zipper transcription factor [Rhizophagus irregularis DAOM 181602=DAOM 197198]CAB4474269.1 unnamed protein product [Rhizophagus irregularis]CAB5210429.1 unnamed protein product [Rhizophagus irregularis]